MYVFRVTLHVTLHLGGPGTNLATLDTFESLPVMFFIRMTVQLVDKIATIVTLESIFFQDRAEIFLALFNS